MGAAGIRVDVTDHLRLGFSLFSPELGTGSRREFIRITTATEMPEPGTPPSQIVVVSEENLHATPAQALGGRRMLFRLRQKVSLSRRLVTAAYYDGGPRTRARVRRRPRKRAVASTIRIPRRAGSRSLRSTGRPSAWCGASRRGTGIQRVS